MQLLDGIDPNPDNFVCAGIVHMRAQQVGCLLRLEPNKQAQVIFQYFQYFIQFLKHFLNYKFNKLFAKLYIVDVSFNGTFE